MELYRLKSFVAIARHRNLTRAAEVLHLSQSAVSSQLKLLEEDLGVTLFQRTTRGMVLTEKGRTLLPHAQEIIASAEKMHQKAKVLNRRISESVTIGLNADPRFLRASIINKRLSLLHSELNVIFQSSQTVNTANMLRQGGLDLGFFYGDFAENEIEHTVIAWVRICVVIPAAFVLPDQTLTWQEVAELPWIWVSDDCPFYSVLKDKMTRYNSMPNRAVTTADEHIVKELVMDGQGVAMMRADEALPLAESGKVVIWEPGWSTIPLSLGWLKKRGQEKGIQTVAEVVRHVWKGAEHGVPDSSSNEYWY